MPQRVEHTVEQGAKGAVGPAVIDWGADDKTVDTILDGSPHFVVKVVIEGAFSQSSTPAASDTALYGLFADADDFRADTLRVQCLGYLFECQACVPVLFRAAVD